MADEIDIGCENEQRDRDLAIAIARQKAQKAMLPPIGICYNCHTPLDDGRYCDGDCRDDHTYRMNAARRAGRLV